jgi:hypothetical protein
LALVDFWSAIDVILCTYFLRMIRAYFLPKFVQKNHIVFTLFA